MSRARFLCGVALVLSAPVFAPLVVSGQERFTGTWLRNEKESDNPGEKFQKAFEGMQGGKGRPPRLPGGGGGPPGGEMPGPPGGMPGTERPADQVETRLQGGEFHVAPAGEGRVRIFYLDGKTHVREAGNGLKIETLAVMKGDRIVVEQKTGMGAKITETYEVSPDGARMVVTVRFEGKRMKEPVVVRTVYDAIESPSARG